MSDSPLDKIKSDPDVANALAHALEPINEHYRKLSRTPLPSGPAEEFTQTPGSAEVIPQYTDFRGTEAMSEGEFRCVVCGKTIADGQSYASIGGNWVPPLPAKMYHIGCIPTLTPAPHIPVTELAAEVLRFDPHSENIKGPTPYSDKSPKSISFYTHNQAEIDRLRYILDSYRTRLQNLRDQLAEALRGLEDFR